VPVEGQICGGVVQGIGIALFEEIPYHGAGRPLASALADYLLPGSAETPADAEVVTQAFE
jgi:aerobic carbon-monoxide dehydrogenase large subunit